MNTPLMFKHSLDNTQHELKIKSFRLSQDMVTLYVELLCDNSDTPIEYPAWDNAGHSVEFTKDSTTWRLRASARRHGGWVWTLRDAITHRRIDLVSFDLTLADGEHRTGACATYGVVPMHACVSDIIDSECQIIQCGNAHAGMALTIINNDLPISWTCVKRASGENSWICDWDTDHVPATKTITESDEDNDDVAPIPDNTRWFVSTGEDASAGLGFRTSNGAFYSTKERNDIIMFDTKAVAEEVAKLYRSCFDYNTLSINVRPERELVTYRYSYALRLSHTADEQYAFLCEKVTPNQHNDIMLCDFAHMSLFIDAKSARASAGVMLNNPKHAYLKSSVCIIRVNVGTKEVEPLPRL